MNKIATKQTNIVKVHTASAESESNFGLTQEEQHSLFAADILFFELPDLLRSRIVGYKLRVHFNKGVFNPIPQGLLSHLFSISSCCKTPDSNDQIISKAWRSWIICCRRNRIEDHCFNRLCALLVGVLDVID